MVASSCTKTGSLSSDRCKMWPSVRATCSKVISGFFFPKLCGFRGQDVHADPRTKPMTYEALISPHFERPEAALLLGAFEPFFHMPSPESNSQHFLDRRVFRCVADEVFDLVCFGVPRHDQPILPIGRTRSAFVGRADPQGDRLDAFPLQCRHQSQRIRHQIVKHPRRR